MFKTDEPSHLKYLEEKVGVETVSRLPGLDRFEFVAWTDGGETSQSKTERS